MELPDLEVLKDNLAPRTVGRTVRGVDVCRPDLWRTPHLGPDVLRGQRLAGVDRRGQYLILVATGRVQLALYLADHGWLWHGGSAYVPTRSTALRLSLDDGNDLRLIEPGPRKLTGLWVGTTPPAPLQELGPDPLSAEFTLAAFRQGLAGRRRQLKRALLDPQLVAGLGEAYADEILFSARLSPFRYLHTLSGDEMARLYTAVPGTLRQAIQAIRSRVRTELFDREVRDFLFVHGRARQPCRVCGTPVGEVLLGGQRTNYCPRCQGVNRPPVE
ncbi:MAG: Fpg/Nei family DNA glycosylase [Candidatus Bipolaricaulaceae bacterium]